MVIIHHEDLMEHDHWPQHPESPFRLRSIRKKLEQEGLWTEVQEPAPLTDEDLLRVHSRDHVDRIRKGGNMPLDPDTMLKDQTFQLATLAAAVATESVQRALKGEMSFALTRPPGHHARANQAGGFCYFNNVAVAVGKAKARTAIVDLDAHHGNGTEEIFYCRDDVLFISLHQMEGYPGTGHLQDVGAEQGLGYNINIPLEIGSGNHSYMKAYEEIVEPILRAFSPDLLIVSLGVDAHYSDTLSNMNLNTPGYLSICQRLMNFMDRRNVAFVLEGGYHLRATAEVVASVVSSFQGKQIFHEYAEERPEPPGAEGKLIQAKKEHGKRWTL
ncbi:MAG: histone deacetylase [Candidatus Methanomethylophilaceae archaeon]|jgi:acetoin utilization deacetylase AcuC-like enzyme